ncbi:AzlC family ABC transporter permease [Desulfogranum japonicum]|uniref:AzlC family ABC transporter permease n=1 Tax=Desulfogranum japonicum TaxID=231447 RepID=UPI0009FD7167|nr:AzlC family ABC transporter permease [Desulfogranum japonicum]
MGPEGCAINIGCTRAEMSAMNVLMFAGSAQFVMVDMWKEPLSVWAVAMAVFVVNLRYVLIGASLRQLFHGQPLWRKAALMHLVADENWAVTIAEQRKGAVSPFFLFGGGVLLLCAWSFGTLSGNLLGGFIRQPEQYGLDFAFIAVFAALALSLWRGRTDMGGWLVAAVLAFLAERYLPGKWYIMIGGVGGGPWFPPCWNCSEKGEPAKIGRTQP